MKTRFIVFNLIIGIIFFATNLKAQVGYYDAPYVRYEADLGTLSGATITSKSYDQSQVQSEASDQICVSMGSGATVSWPVTVAGDGLVVRFSIPDGATATLDVYNNTTKVGTLNLNTNWSWQYLGGSGGVVNYNPKMRFDEVRLKLGAQIPAGNTLKLVCTGISSGVVSLDFAELEPVPAAVTIGSGEVNYTGNGSDLQSVINGNTGKTIYLGPNVYSIPNTLVFSGNNTTLKGAGSWYTELNFTNTSQNQGGLWGQASGISYSGLYLTTVNDDRATNYKALNGVYTSTSTIKDVWAEHFECGAWIAQFGAGPSTATNFKISYCRFRDTYADGTNLSRGTSGATVEHCSFRNNGDDAMAIWPADNLSTDNNTFQYNTSENCWRASGCAIYGGQSNQALYLLIKDPVEAGLRVNNTFAGSPFSSSGQHVFSNIKVVSAGTNLDLFNNRVGAIDLVVSGTAGTQIINVKFSCIELTDSKNDAIDINKLSGDGFYSVVLENIKINGTGKEYPSNGGANANRGFGIYQTNSPNIGSSTQCGISYSNISGGSSASNTNGFSWPMAGSCPGNCNTLSTTSKSISLTAPANPTIYDPCGGAVTLSASAAGSGSITVSSVDFLVDGTVVNNDNSSPYSYNWTGTNSGTHTISAIAHFSDLSTLTSTSSIVNEAVIQTTSAPTIDGTIDAQWSNFPSVKLLNSVNGKFNSDINATYSLTYNSAGLYIMVYVTDDAVTTGSSSGNTYDQDGIELFFDVGNTDKTTYTGNANDLQFGFLYYTGATPPAIINYHGSSTGASYAAKTISSPTPGYVMEIKMPWSTLGLGSMPTSGTYMGFDVGVNDNDGGGSAVRTDQLSWTDGSFTEYNNPSLFGTIEFSSCAALPVNMISFTGENINETVVLNWVTVSETNNAKFIIERSANSSDWESIGELAGAGNTNSLISYSFTDYSPLSATNYYRLKQVDVDGASTYSKAISVEATTQSSSVSVMPNPFEDALTIKTSIKENLDISIHDVLGRPLYQMTQKAEGGMLRIQPDLISGTYIITIQSNGFVEKQKVIKR